jgi:hypothetical protein
MDWHIEGQLQQIMPVRESQLDLIYRVFLSIIQNWWKNCNYSLRDTNCKENDPLRKTSETVGTTLLAKIPGQRKSELDDLGIKYKVSAINDMKQLIEPHRVVLIFAPGRSTTLTAVKIHQVLSVTKHLILNLQQLIHYKIDVMLAWKSMFDVLVLESQSSNENLQDVFSEISVFMNECNVEKKLIFIAQRTGNAEEISAIRRTVSTEFTEEYDDWKITDIVTESKTYLLEKKIIFQGLELQIKDIVKKSDIRMLNTLDGDSMSFLLGDEKPSIGNPIEEALDYYIDRTLDCVQYVRVWRPSTLLDGEDRIVLVIDEPGMGKSALLTHLAKETRQRHPGIWIVRVNIKNYTSILHEIKTNGFDENGLLKLLTEAAQIKEPDSMELETQLFNYMYNSTGNMAVLIDGVDEVGPHYTEEVIQLLRILSKTKIIKIWFTSRNFMERQLEQEFQCHSYSLLPFSVEEQKSFLLKFWNQKQDYAKVLANRIVQPSYKHLSDGDKYFMGVPLQGM